MRFARDQSDTTMKAVLLLFALCVTLSAAAKPVNVELYYEVYVRAAGNFELCELGLYSLCPDCKLWTTKQLYPLLKAAPEMINITYVPFGNAIEYKAGDKVPCPC